MSLWTRLCGNESTVIAKTRAPKYNNQIIHGVVPQENREEVIIRHSALSLLHFRCFFQTQSLVFISVTIIHMLQITIFHMLDLSRQLSCIASTPVFLTCGWFSSSCLYFCLNVSPVSACYVFLGHHTMDYLVVI